MAASRIVAQPQTLTGSIGVLAGKFSVEGLAGKLGITTEKLAYGEKADIFSPFRPFTAAERKVLKDEILWTYDRFLDKAAAGRGLAKEDVDKAGKGRVWTGRQALELKLVDELGGLRDAVAFAAAKAGIEKEYRTVYFRAFPGFFGSLKVDASPVGVARAIGQLLRGGTLTGFDEMVTVF